MSAACSVGKCRGQARTARRDPGIASPGGSVGIPTEDVAGASPPPRPRPGKRGMRPMRTINHPGRLLTQIAAHPPVHRHRCTPTLAATSVTSAPARRDVEHRAPNRPPVADQLADMCRTSADGEQGCRARLGEDFHRMIRGTGLHGIKGYEAHCRSRQVFRGSPTRRGTGSAARPEGSWVHQQCRRGRSTRPRLDSDLSRRDERRQLRLLR